MKKINILLSMLLLLTINIQAQNIKNALKNGISRVSLSANFGQNRSSYANPKWFGGTESMVDQRKRLVQPRITNRYGFGAAIRFYKNFSLHVGINYEERGWFRDSMPLWVGHSFSTNLVFIRAELIHRFVSYPILLEYEMAIAKKVKIGFNTGLVIANRRPLNAAKFSELTKRTGVFANEVTDESPRGFDPYPKLVLQNRGLMYIPAYSQTHTDYSINIGLAVKFALSQNLYLGLKTNYQVGIGTFKNWSEFGHIRHQVYSGLIELSYSLSHLVGKKEK